MEKSDTSLSHEKRGKIMKREREEGEYEAFDMVDCLLLLSKVGDHQYKRSEEQQPKASFPLPGSRKVFVCKTCNRQFSSFQALGGHRASHKKPRFMDDIGGEMKSMPVKPKAHECLVCGLEFPIGQALGGHMRRHRNIERVTTATEMVGVIKKTRKRVFGLDLNLTPVENDLKLQLMIPIVDCFN